MEKRELGRRAQVCRICGKRGKFRTYLAREMMQGKRDAFLYFVCDGCHCLQIASVPDDLGSYYGAGYYSYQVKEDPEMRFGTPVTDRRKILDVGCGAGAWLLEMAERGAGELYGCDPFLDHDRHYGDRVRIFCRTIHEMEGDGTFDLIHMGDSFEHMTDPLEVLRSARRLLKDDGMLQMTIPTYPNIAFEQFGPYWYQLDAPRHIFLHSRESLAHLASKSGMVISDIRYDSNNSQFIRSYLYEQDIPFYEQAARIGQYFSPKRIAELDKASAVANAREYGDHMEVRWRKDPVLTGDGGKRAVFVRASRHHDRRSLLYPQVYQDADTDYLCFTDGEDPVLPGWTVCQVEEPEPADLEPYLKGYAARWELRPDQIQMGTLWGGHPGENIVTVPRLEDLPGVTIDLSNFTPTADENGDYIYRRNPVYKGGKYNGRPLLLTIGVPVSDQIQTIDRCLSHIKPLLDGLDAELLVIDTGSTDGTLDVCRRYGARIVTHPWCDDMSAVRNEGIYNARGQWYMSIDDDEWFEDVGAILDFFRNGTYRRCNVAMYRQRNYTDSAGERYEDLASLRLAEITEDLHFEGRIHDAMMIKGHRTGLVLDAYVHHYGSVRDDPERERAKAVRNLAILPYDVYEYPDDVRYLFQLGKECSVTMGRETSICLLAQVCALSKAKKIDQYGKNSVMDIIYELYQGNDRRLFLWAEHLLGLFHFTWAEQAAAAWYLEELGATLGRPAHEVVGYHKAYKENLARYRADPEESRRLTMHGLSFVERNSLIMDADAVAFGKYIELGEEEKAAQLLSGISLEDLKNKRTSLLQRAFGAGDEVFGALCAQIADRQWEEWSRAILDVFVLTLKQADIRERQEQRLPQILSHMSVDAVVAWVESHERKYKGETGERLIAYALRLDIERASVQELCMASWMLKEEYVDKRGTPEGRVVFRQYILATGVFAVRYHSEELLVDASSCAIPPDIRAAYRIAAVLMDGTARRENVALLKQALEIFPLFHEEIREILVRLYR